MKITACSLSLAMFTGPFSSCLGQDANAPAAGSRNFEGRYSGLIYPPDGVVPERSGYFNIKVSARGHLNGWMWVGKRRDKLRGHFNGQGVADFVAYNKTKEECKEDGKSDPWDDLLCDRVRTWFVHLELSDDGEQIRGAVRFARSTRWTTGLYGYRAGFGGQSPPATPAGKYTILLPGSAVPQAGPAGHGYGTVTVDVRGNVRLTGLLADGTRISQGAVLTRNGVWPLFASTHGGDGALIGWVTFEQRAQDDLAGPLQWIKPKRAGQTYYPEGFAVETVVTGSRYIPPASGLSPWDWTNGTVALGGGNLSDPITAGVEFDGGNQLTLVSGAPAQFKLKVKPATGTFDGAFQHPDTGRTSKSRGVVLQKQNLGAGFFLGSSQSGYVLVAPAH